MAITLTKNFLAELKKNVNAPNVILEFELDSGTKKFGMHTGGFSDVMPAVKSVSSLQNKLDIKKGYSTRGEITVVLVGRENFKGLVAGEYLKNRRVTRKDGFLSQSFRYLDYASTFTGIISDWSRKGDELTITVSDDLIDATSNIPEENDTNTQYLNYVDKNPADIMADILLNQLGIEAKYVDSAKFSSERDLWLNGWRLCRVLTDPEAANEYLNELQIESNSYIIHDGEKISFKVFAPAVPGEEVEEWTDDCHILKDSFSEKSGYKDNFYNRVAAYYDYDESGSDGADNFESAVIAIDAGSQDTSQWDEASLKTVKSKWIRSYKFSQPSNITGVVVYHASKANGGGAGSLSYSAANATLQWTAPSGAAGEAVEVSEDGRYDIYDTDETKYVRVVVTTGNLPSSDAADSIAISALNGAAYASSLAGKILNLYRDPSATVAFDIDLNSAACGSRFIKPTDLKDVTTGEAFEKGAETWTKERVMITSVRPDFSAHKVSIEALETKMYRRYGFIAPEGYPDYPSASENERERAFAGNASNNVAGSIDGYYIW